MKKAEKHKHKGHLHQFEAQFGGAVRHETDVEEVKPAVSHFLRSLTHPIIVAESRYGLPDAIVVRWSYSRAMTIQLTILPLTDVGGGSGEPPQG